MPRTYLCIPLDSVDGEYIPGTAHYWTAEVDESWADNPLSHESATRLCCPDHDQLPNNEGPEQSENMFLVEYLQQYVAQVPMKRPDEWPA